MVEKYRKMWKIQSCEVCDFCTVLYYARFCIIIVFCISLHFLAKRDDELAFPPLFWSVSCIKIGGHVALLSCLSIYFLFYGPKQLLRCMPKQATYSILHEVLLEGRSLSPVTRPDNSVYLNRKIGEDVKEILLGITH